MAISHASHPHKLVLKPADCPYYCGGCDQLGFGSSYTCSKSGSGCNFFLHQQCGNPKPLVEYPFSDKCVLKFRKEGSGKDASCEACGKKVKGFHYKCLCRFQIRYLHPGCLNYEETLDPVDGLTLRLKKAAPTKCLHCETKDLWSKVRGWAYVSSCGEYCYHVSCVREIINNNWKYGFFKGKSEPFQSIKEAFPANMDRLQVIVGRNKGKPRRKKASAVLSILFNVLTGNPLGLIGTAQTYFG